MSKEKKNPDDVEEFEDEDDLDYDDDDFDDSDRYGIEGVSSPSVSSPHVSKGKLTAQHTTPTEPIDDNYDADRYNSAHGWRPPPDPYKKRREEVRLANPEIYCDENMLTCRTANESLAGGDTCPKHPPAHLFGEMWKEGDLTILFADTGTGKSVLAMQIAESLARGRPIMESGEWKMENSSEHSTFSIFHSPLPSQKVLYLDFELTDAQFKERYSTRTSDGREYAAQYEFSDNLIRPSIQWDGSLPPFFKNESEFLSFSITKTLRETGIKVVIVDNISYLATANTNAGAALRLMKALNGIKKEYGVSILVLAHTPKRSIARPLSVNDLAGSKMLSNFTDNLIGIGQSTRDKRLRYIKQIKPRNSPATYDASNVIVCRLEKMLAPGTAGCQPASAVSSPASVSSPHVSKGPTTTENTENTELAEKPLQSPNPHSAIRDPQSQDCFLGFRFITFANERLHTTRPYDNTNADRQNLIATARKLYADGLTQREIAAELDIGLTTVNRYLSEQRE